MAVNSNMRDMVLSNYVQMRAPILILDIDEHGIVTNANQYAKKILGNDCPGRALSLMLVDFRKSFDISRLRTLRHGELMSFISCTGAPVSLRVSFLPVGSCGIVVGEYDQQEAEELQTTLIKLNSELSSISRELQKKTLQLQQANDLKNQFMGIAAHDLRSPLAGVISYIELIKYELTPLKGTHISEGLDEIYNEVKYMLNLVSNLLDYSVIEQGRLDLALQQTNLRELLQHVFSLNSMIADRRSIKLRLEIEEDPGDVNLDLNPIRPVTTNHV